MAIVKSGLVLSIAELNREEVVLIKRGVQNQENPSKSSARDNFCAQYILCVV